MSPAAHRRFTQFYCTHHRKLWSYIVRIGADPVLAEDLGQEAFLRWSQSRAAGWDEARARAYLFAIATRLLTDAWRARRREVGWDDIAGEIAAAPAGESLLFHGRAWAGLTRRQQQLLWLAYVEGFDHAEIGRIAGLAPASIRVLLSRARAALAAQLKPDLEEGME